MKQKGKRLFSVLLALVLVLSLFPAITLTALAADYSAPSGNSMEEGFTLNSDGSITATFNVTNNYLNMRGRTPKQ